MQSAHTGFPRGVSFLMNLGGGVPPYHCDASGASPGGGEYRGELGVDARREHHIVVLSPISQRVGDPR